MSRRTVKYSPKLLRKDDQESAKKARRFPVDSLLQNPHWLINA